MKYPGCPKYQQVTCLADTVVIYQPYICLISSLKTACENISIISF